MKKNSNLRQNSFGQTVEEIREHATFEYRNHNYSSAIHLWTLAANQGDAHAQYYMGLCYLDGHSVQQSYQTAAEWFQLAANQGLSAAQYNLGVSYEFGNGVPKSCPTAIEWYEKAAKKGSTAAKIALKRLNVWRSPNSN